MVLGSILFLYVALHYDCPPALDLYLESVRAEQENFTRMVNYVFQEDIRTRAIKRDGKMLFERQQGYEVTILEGAYYYKRVRTDGKPLSASALRKETERMEREAESRRRRRAAGEPVTRTQDKRFALHYQRLDRFADFVCAGREDVNGRPAMILRTQAKLSATEAQSVEDQFLARSRFTIWLDLETRHPVRIHAAIQESVYRFPAGTTVTYEFQRLDSGWLRNRVIQSRPVSEVALKIARVTRLETSQEYHNFQKFQADSSVRLALPEAPEPDREP
jgi:hypothetical protein